MSVSVLFTSEFTLPSSLEAEWLGALPAQRRDRIRHWPERRDRQRSLIGSRLLAEALRRLGHPAGALATLRYPPRARPTIDLPVQFSLAHCEGKVACVLSTCGPVGVDVEALGPLTAQEFPNYLSDAERAWAGRSACRFYSVWTRKEAVAKAAGTRGLPSLPEVDTSAGEHRASFAGRLWRTAPIAIGPGHVGHVALDDMRAPLELVHVAEQALL